MADEWLRDGEGWVGGSPTLTGGSPVPPTAMRGAEMGRAASYRVGPPGTAWDRINFFLRTFRSGTPCGRPPSQSGISLAGHGALPGTGGTARSFRTGTGVCASPLNGASLISRGLEQKGCFSGHFSPSTTLISRESQRKWPKKSFRTGTLGSANCAIRHGRRVYPKKKLSVEWLGREINRTGRDLELAIGRGLASFHGSPRQSGGEDNSTKRFREF
jgi:hypothetical protein